MVLLISVLFNAIKILCFQAAAYRILIQLFPDHNDDFLPHFDRLDHQILFGGIHLDPLLFFILHKSLDTEYFSAGLVQEQFFCGFL